MPLAPFLTALSRLLFPPFCPVCRERLGGGTAATGLCPRCQSSVARLRPPLCRLCGMELAGEGAGGRLCGECLVCPPPFLVARSLLRYEGAVAPLVRRLKYQSDTSVLPAMAALVANADLGEFADCDAIVPVPLHLSRHRRRGLNQAALLAALFLNQMGQDEAQNLLQERPKDGWPDTATFVSLPAVMAASSGLGDKLQKSVAVTSYYFEGRLQVEMDDLQVRFITLFKRQNSNKVTVIRRQYGGSE